MYTLSFNAPLYLLLLALLPALWWYGFRRLVLLGRVRSVVVVLLRTVVMLAIILALAEMQLMRVHDKLTVIYLLDQSASIPAPQRRAMIEYVNGAIETHRRLEDRVGAIVFGREAAIEMPPIDDDVAMTLGIESPLDPEYTNLAGALKLAQATFPEDAAKRIVIVSDGNENLGDVMRQAQGVAAGGIGIDVLPIRYQTGSEVIVERLALPSDIRRGEPFQMKVVITNTAENENPVAGRLQISRLAGGSREVISDETTVLKPGKTVLSVPPMTIDTPNFYSYEARFIPDRPEDDAMAQNNRATAFTHVRGKGRVLLIEDFQNKGEFDQLQQRLGLQGLEVTLQGSDQLFSTPGDLMPFDAVLLANVPREHFSDDQIRMLATNTQQMGAGLVMLGGPNSFGAGGWANTEVERAMPVDFQIKNAKVVPRGALVMMMHACEIPQGNYWQKRIAREAIKTLGARDYCGVLFWGAKGDQWMWGKGLAPVGANRGKMLAAIDRMTPGDMPAFDPAMQMALRGFNGVPDAAVKHMIIISDGDPSYTRRSLTGQLSKAGVTISTVAVGAHGTADSRLLATIARQANGKYYAVRNAKALPRIFQREARRVARPLIHRNANGFRPFVNAPHEMIDGMEQTLPPITGFVMTTKKDNPLVEVSLASPEPGGGKNSTILASWTYGLGKAVVFTSDAGARWTDGWLDQSMYDTLFAQIVRWSMRPGGTSGQFTVAAETVDQEVRLVVTALDKDDEFINFLTLSGSAIGPDLKSAPIEMQQTAPGRYVGRFPAGSAGSYFVALSHGLKDVAPILTGINVPYSDEFRNRDTNDQLLGELAQMSPEDGKPGRVIELPDNSKLTNPLLAVNTFRHGELAKATSSRDVWHLVILIGSCLFFFDVFFRRVQVSFAWVGPLAGRVRDAILRREPKPPVIETMDRLRSRKAAVGAQIKQLHADARFEPDVDADVSLDALDERPGHEAPKPTVTDEDPQEEESHTERLLRAKKKVWRDKQQ